MRLSTAKMASATAVRNSMLCLEATCSSTKSCSVSQELSAPAQCKESFVQAVQNFKLLPKTHSQDDVYTGKFCRYL